MINLVPPSLKEQRRYSEYNRRLMRYIVLILGVFAVIAVSFVFAWLQLDRSQSQLTREIEARQQSAIKFGSIEADAKVLADRLASIEKIQSEKNRYPALLEELGRTTPSDAYIYTFSVDPTGKTMNLTAYANSDQAVAAFKNSLEASSRFRAVALDNVAQEKDPYDGSPTNRVVMTIGLEESALK